VAVRGERQLERARAMTVEIPENLYQGELVAYPGPLSFLLE